MENYYKLGDIVNGLLAPIYQMAKYSMEWIKEFWIKLTSYYKGDNRNEKRLAEEIIEDTLKFKHIKLAEYLPTELCNLAEMFWTYSPMKNYNRYDFGFYERDRHSMAYQYGLSKKAEYYEHGSNQNNAIESNFFCILFNKNFWIGLNWSINFVNKLVLDLSEKYEGGLPIYEVNFIIAWGKKYASPISG